MGATWPGVKGTEGGNVSRLQEKEGNQAYTTAHPPHPTTEIKQAWQAGERTPS